MEILLWHSQKLLLCFSSNTKLLLELDVKGAKNHEELSKTSIYLY